MWHKPIALAYVVGLRENLQVPLDVQAAHGATLQWDDVIDFVSYAGALRGLSGGNIHGSDGLLVDPRRCSGEPSCPPSRIQGVDYAGIGPSPFQMLLGYQRLVLLEVLRSVGAFLRLHIAGRSVASSIGVGGRGIGQTLCLVSRSGGSKVVQSLSLFFGSNLLSIRFSPSRLVSDRFGRALQVLGASRVLLLFGRERGFIGSVPQPFALPVLRSPLRLRLSGLRQPVLSLFVVSHHVHCTRLAN